MISIESYSYETVFAVIVSLLVLLALILGKALAFRQLHKFAARGRLAFLSYPEQIVGATRLPFMIGVALLAGASQLELSAHYEKWLHYGWVVVLVSQIALWANRLVTAAVKHRRQTNPSDATHLMMASLIARIVLWSLATPAASR